MDSTCFELVKKIIQRSHRSYENNESQKLQKPNNVSFNTIVTDKLKGRKFSSILIIGQTKVFFEIVLESKLPEPITEMKIQFYI